MRSRGLSPLVRGNHSGSPFCLLLLRSIPACAGEPIVSLLSVWCAGVYPRLCGETRRRGAGGQSLEGLSPLVRGNPRQIRFQPGHHRSIPACAGEPGLHTPAPPLWAVYPRLCGGTSLSIQPTTIEGGLSPLVRGNLRHQRAHLIRERSIPACAGEPRHAIPKIGFARVYPRLCGGTANPRVHHAVQHGLSPLVRGNPPVILPEQAIGRSIPACAGEPFRSGRTWSGSRVYPRLCGGTKMFSMLS